MHVLFLYKTCFHPGPPLPITVKLNFQMSPLIYLRQIIFFITVNILFPTCYLLLDAFASPCSSVCPHGTTGQILMKFNTQNFFLKYVEKMQVLLKIRLKLRVLYMKTFRDLEHVAEFFLE
jgi:hypothetical protein